MRLLNKRILKKPLNAALSQVFLFKGRSPITGGRFPHSSTELSGCSSGETEEEGEGGGGGGRMEEMLEEWFVRSKAVNCLAQPT